MAIPSFPKAPGNRVIKRTIAAKKRVLTVKNRVTDLASPNTPRTPNPVSARNSNGPKGGSGKSGTPANRTYKKDFNTTKAKAPRVTKAKLNTTKKTPFNRSTRVNYRQLRSK